MRLFLTKVFHSLLSQAVFPHYVSGDGEGSQHCTPEHRNDEASGTGRDIVTATAIRSRYIMLIKCPHGVSAPYISTKLF